MNDQLQEWLVYGIVAMSLALLVWRKLRRREDCENCPIQRISRNR